MARALFGTLPDLSAAKVLCNSLADIGEAMISFLALDRRPAFQHERAHKCKPAGSSLVKIFATGQLKWALQGASVSSTSVSAISRALRGLGMPNFEARQYELLVRSGRVLICVSCEDAIQFKRAKTLLQRNGVEELASSGEPEMRSIPTLQTV